MTNPVQSIAVSSLISSHEEPFPILTLPVEIIAHIGSFWTRHEKMRWLLTSTTALSQQPAMVEQLRMSLRAALRPFFQFVEGCFPNSITRFHDLRQSLEHRIVTMTLKNSSFIEATIYTDIFKFLVNLSPEEVAFLHTVAPKNCELSPDFLLLFRILPRVLDAKRQPDPNILLRTLCNELLQQHAFNASLLVAGEMTDNDDECACSLFLTESIDNVLLPRRLFEEAVKFVHAPGYRWTGGSIVKIGEAMAKIGEFDRAFKLRKTCDGMLSDHDQAAISEKARFDIMLCRELALSRQFQRAREYADRLSRGPKALAYVEICHGLALEDKIGEAIDLAHTIPLFPPNYSDRRGLAIRRICIVLAQQNQRERAIELANTLEGRSKEEALNVISGDVSA